MLLCVSSTLKISSGGLFHCTGFGVFFGFGVLIPVPHSLWDLSSPTRDQAQVLSSESGVLTPGQPGNSPFPSFFWFKFLKSKFL